MVSIFDENEVRQSLRKRALFDGVIALVPAFNAEKTVGDVVRKVRRKVPRCIVVDDGSTDNTARFAENARAELILHASNRGKGAAIRSGLSFLKDQDFKYLILLDADGQHEPGEIYRFIQHARRTKADVVCGTRMRNPKDMPWLRLVTNRAMSAIISFLCKVQIHDTQCGYRLLSKQVVDTVELRKSNFETDSELLLEASYHGFKVSEVSVTSIYGDEHSSHIRPVRDTLRFIRLLAGLALRRLFRRNKKTERTAGNIQ